MTPEAKAEVLMRLERSWAESDPVLAGSGFGRRLSFMEAQLLFKLGRKH